MKSLLILTTSPRLSRRLKDFVAAAEGVGMKVHVEVATAEYEDTKPVVCVFEDIARSYPYGVESPFLPIGILR